jgi:hypothetical protein
VVSRKEHREQVKASPCGGGRLTPGERGYAVGEPGRRAFVLSSALFIGAIAPAIMSGMFSAFKTVPLYTAGDVVKASRIAKDVGAAYSPPTKAK